LAGGLFVPKAEYLDQVATHLEDLTKDIHAVWKALAEADEEGNDDNVYHALNDLAGTCSKKGEDGGFFHTIMETYF